MSQSQGEYESWLDDDLVEGAQGGDHLAFSELIRRFQPSCLKVAMSILHDRPDAEDEVQNAHWKAFEHIKQFHRDAKFSTWLSRIVVNQCLMRLRQQRRARLFYVDDVQPGEDSKSIDLPDHRETPEVALAKRELAVILRKEIDRIPPLLRRVFLLRDVQELPMPQVAKELGISVAAAKSRLLRARVELRQRLTKYHGRHGEATLMA